MSHEELVPAFESALGVAPPGGQPVVVKKAELEAWNEELKVRGTHTQKYQVEAANVAALFAKRAIRPDEIAAQRRRMFEIVGKNLEMVDDVLAGKRQWSATQVRLFSILTERVMPKLSTITVEDPTSKKLEDLSLEELEAIAMGKKKAGAVDAIMKKAEVFDEISEKKERRETKRSVLNGLAYINALDEAEKKYIAERVSASSAEMERKMHAQLANQELPQKPEVVAKHRANATKGMGYKEHLLAKGYSEEEASALEKQRLDKLHETQRRNREAKLKRLALTGGLGDAVKIPEDIRKVRYQALKEFKVNPLKGVRSQAAILKEKEIETAREKREREKAFNPRTRIGRGLSGVPEELQEGLTLEQLRQYRPDLIENGTRQPTQPERHFPVRKKKAEGGE